MQSSISNHQLAIKLANVSKKYEIHHEKPTLVEKFVKGNNETFWALKNINLAIGKGERVGLIGPNGSGKTTLLKIITGITSPTQGSVETLGKVVSLIDLEAGFHDDLTGEENIFLNGLILGMSKNHITRRLSRIIEFADIKQFIDAPLFTYSAGMKLRLGFAVAIFSDPDILIIDEGFAVGDQDFQEKSKKKIQEIVSRGTTILMATHWLDYVRKNCNRIIALDKGTIAKVTRGRAR